MDLPTLVAKPDGEIADVQLSNVLASPLHRAAHHGYRRAYRAAL
jgi:hypothetical protein